MSRNRLRRVGVAFLVALSLSASSIASATAADDASYNLNCSSGRICIYKDSNLTGSLAATCGSCIDSDYTNDDYPNFAGGMNDTLSSSVNYKTSGKVIWYSSVNYAGTPFCLNHGIAAIYVGSSFNDRASAHAVLTGSC